MKRKIQNELHEMQRKNAIYKGAIPPGVDTDVMDRLSAASQADWYGVVRRFTRFQAKVRARYMNAAYGAEPLLVLEIIPLGNFPTTKPPNTETPWHVSVGFYDRAYAREFKALVNKYRNFEVKTLVGHIQGASFELDTLRCEVGSDPLLQNLHRLGHYGNRPLHISL